LLTPETNINLSLLFLLFGNDFLSDNKQILARFDGTAQKSADIFIGTPF
jgi:hypothetical protein